MIKVILSNNMPLEPQNVARDSGSRGGRKSPRTNRCQEWKRDMKEKSKQRENQAAGLMRHGDTGHKGDAEG